MSSELVSRLSAAIFSGEAGSRLNPHLPIRNETGGSLSIRQLVNLFDLLGVDAWTPLYAGWWSGFNEIDDYTKFLGDEFEVVSLVRSSELEWHVWRTFRDNVYAAATYFRQTPGVFAPASGKSWVICTGPADESSYLYIEPSESSADVVAPNACPTDPMTSGGNPSNR